MGQKKRGVGRPSKYDTIDLEQVEKLAGYGLTDEEIGDFLGISHQTINTYKDKHPEFLESLKRGKVRSDTEVVKSLYKRAVGYEEDDVYFCSYQGRVTKVPYKKRIIPDVVAQIFWLKNRRRQDWREKDDTGITPEDFAKAAGVFAEMVSAAGTGRATPSNH